MSSRKVSEWLEIGRRTENMLRIVEEKLIEDTRKRKPLDNRLLFARDLLRKVVDDK